METVKSIIFSNKIKGGKYFTNIPVKKYFKKNILTQSPITINNPVLVDNDYTIEAYGSMATAVKSYIDSCLLSNGDTIALHPFTPIEVVEIIKNMGVNIVFYNINIDNLSVQKTNFENIINVQKPKLIIHYTINQLLSELQEELDFITKHNSELLVIDNSISHNNEYFELINTMPKGAYIKLLSDNFSSQLIKDLIDVNIDRVPIYLTLNFGLDLLTSLTPKAIKNLPLQNEYIDTIYQLLFNKNIEKGLVSTLKNSLIKNTLSSQKNMTNEQLIESYGQIQNVTKGDMIPDYIFELVNTLGLVVENQNQEFNLQFQKNKNSKKLKIKNLIDNNLNSDATITVPECCMLRESSAFHIVTNDQKYWYNTLKFGGLEFYRLPTPHDDLYNNLDDSLNEVINKTLVTIL